MKPLKKSRVLIIGLGQIGGSLGMELVKKRLVAEVTGFDQDKSLTSNAIKLKAVDRMTDSLEEEIGKMDLVIIAVPIREIIKLIPAVGRFARKDALILDVGSTKSEIMKKVFEVKLDANYIGAHPLAGSEKTGLASAELGKFVNKTFVLIPSPRTRPDMLEKIRKLIINLGAKPFLMTAREHDQAVALTSHLPYLLSEALMRLSMKYGKKTRSVWKLIGSSFKSATRVALSSPELTLDMFLTNQKNLLKVTDEMIKELSSWKTLIEKKDEVALRKSIEMARKQREKIQNG